MPASSQNNKSPNQFLFEKDDLGRLRSASPAVKRPASDMGAQDRESYTSDVEMEMGEGQTPTDAANGSSFAASVHDSVTNSAAQDIKAKQLDTGARHHQNQDENALSHRSDPRALQQGASVSDQSAGSNFDSLVPSPSGRSTAATSLSSDIPPTTALPPPVDEQIAQVTHLLQKECQEGQKGFVISAKWFQKVQARGSLYVDVKDKSATEGDVGPVDNSDIALVIENDGKLLDEGGENFVPLRPGLTMDEDYRIFPQEAWDLIISWYGLKKDSPVVTRYAHDWSEPDAVIPNVTWELNPPIFSFLKVPSEYTTQTQREKDTPPQRMVASKKMLANDWLKKGKQLLSIDMNTKVRVWRILGGLKNSASGMMTPMASRSASPAPGTEIVATAGDRMLLDVNSFARLQLGEHRELLTDIKDNTANTSFNGRSLTLQVVGLGRNEEVIVLEEQKADKEEWPSESSKLSLNKGVKSAGKGLTPSGRSSPALGMMTRGRQKQNGRPSGITGLTNLGNTCYMNSALQCLRSVPELTRFFLLDQWKVDLNVDNPLGYHGEVAKAYANLLHQIYDEGSSSTSPAKFKVTVGKYGPSFSGYQQQDSQEFLLFLLDALQEDLNRVKKKPYFEKTDSTNEMVTNPEALQAFANKNWYEHEARNDSVITDLFTGMYKSTVTCPVCDKVSITFDPFLNLTLHLPIENNWQKEILFFPLHKPPIRVDVDVDKHSSFLQLKEFIASRTHAAVDKMIIAESYKNKFYKIFDNNATISDANIQTNDIICAYELDAVPTNYNPNKAKKFQAYMSKNDDDEVADEDSVAADRILVPLYHRLVRSPMSRVTSKPFFGQPSYLVLSRSDRATYDGVMRKILGNLVGMTTKRILEEDAMSESVATPNEGSDVLVTADELSSSSSGLPTATSVQGEDNDVSMREPSQVPETTADSAETEVSTLFQPGWTVPKSFHQLFDILTATTGEGIATGWNQISESTEYESIKKRIPKAMSMRSGKSNRAPNPSEGDSTSGGSDEELADIENDADTPVDSNDSGIDASPEASSGDLSDNEFPEPPAFVGPRSKKAQRRAKNAKFRGKHNKRDKRRSPIPPPQPLPKAMAGGLIRPGEAVILDWSQDGYDALFGGSDDEADGMRGRPTWKSVELLPDEQITAKRQLRNSRKKNGITLEDCLNEFGKSETLSENNAWYCPQCKEHRRAEKMFELWKAPDILVMHLKRFSSNRNFRDKLEVRVDYPTDGLDLSNMVKDKEDSRSLVYDLIAVDNHYGGLGGGHYTAFAKHAKTNVWHEYNGKDRPRLAFEPD
jgi:ubiquitin carboxyl-terminal hydrolase 4/11